MVPAALIAGAVVLGLCGFASLRPGWLPPISPIATILGSNTLPAPTSGTALRVLGTFVDVGGMRLDERQVSERISLSIFCFRDGGSYQDSYQDGMSLDGSDLDWVLNDAFARGNGSPTRIGPVIVTASAGGFNPVMVVWPGEGVRVDADASETVIDFGAITLPPARPKRLRLLDAQTRQPVKWAKVTSVAALWQVGAQTAHTDFGHRVELPVSGGGGDAVIPAGGGLRIQAEVVCPGYAVETVEIRPDRGNQTPVDILLQPTAPTVLTVTTPDGESVPGVVAFYQDRDRSGQPVRSSASDDYERMSGQKTWGLSEPSFYLNPEAMERENFVGADFDGEGRLELPWLSPEHRTDVMLYAEGRSPTKVEALRPGQTRSVAMKEAVTIRGRLTGAIDRVLSRGRTGWVSILDFTVDDPNDPWGRDRTYHGTQVAADGTFEIGPVVGNMLELRLPHGTERIPVEGSRDDVEIAIPPE